ncbi:MAG: hypothetical protein LUM44_17635 [Pyrinomonadaceae bacterium]|nr:hypothetical protein [Pyrinomonadaceae bacterium]
MKANQFVTSDARNSVLELATSTPKQVSLWKTQNSDILENPKIFFAPDVRLFSLFIETLAGLYLLARFAISVIKTRPESLLVKPLAKSAISLNPNCLLIERLTSPLGLLSENTLLRFFKHIIKQIVAIFAAMTDTFKWLISNQLAVLAVKH